MKQFLLTRFNIYSGSELKFDPETDVDYLRHRFELFDKYTVPSVYSQTARDFKWIVLFSDRLPNEFVKKVTEYEEKYEFFEGRYLSKEQVFPKRYMLNESIKKIISDYTQGEVILTRMDNDDVIADNYLENVKNAAEKHHLNYNFAINFSRGLQYDETNKVLIKYNRPHNHFFSICTHISDDFIEPLCQNHENIMENMELREEDSSFPQWMEIIHGNNLSNFSHIKCTNIVWSKRSIEGFSGIDELHTCSIIKAYVGILKNRWFKGTKR